MSKSSVLAAALTLGLALSAQAGLTMLQSYHKLDGKSEPTTNTIHLDKDRVRIESGTSPDTYFIYRGDKQVFWTVNLKEKSYMEMTEKDFEEMAAKMDDAMKKMQAQMANMPPAQKKMMEDMMAKMMPGGAKAPKTTFKKVGSGGKVNGWNTDKYEGIREGVKTSEIWAAEPKSLDFSEGDMQVLKDMAKFFEKFAKNMEGLVGDKSRNGLEGVPVKTVTFKDGQPEFETQMKEVKKESQAASLFEVPAGLTMKKMGKPQ